MKALAAVWKRVVEFHKSRLIVKIFSLSKDQFKEVVDDELNKAKRISDFVGLIIRWSFVQFAAYYFVQKSQQVDFWLSKLAFGSCASLAYVLTIYIGIRFALLVFFFWVSDVHYHQSKIGRTVVILLSTALTGVIWFGISTMVRDIAKSSQLLSP